MPMGVNVSRVTVVSVTDNGNVGSSRSSSSGCSIGNRTDTISCNEIPWLLISYVFNCTAMIYGPVSTNSARIQYKV